MLAELGGLYCEDCDVALRAETTDEPFVGVRSYATDPDEAERLWKYSVAAVANIPPMATVR
jgi:hypothetical protein